MKKKYALTALSMEKIEALSMVYLNDREKKQCMDSINELRRFIQSSTLVDVGGEETSHHTYTTSEMRTDKVHIDTAYQLQFKLNSNKTEKNYYFAPSNLLKE